MMAEVIEALVRYSQSQLTKETQETEDKTLAISCAALFRAWKPGKYKEGNIRTKDGVPYEARIDHDNAINPDWTIDVRTVWKPYHSRQKKWALPFIHPTCADDMYKTGEFAVFKDKIYMANQDTSYSPEEYSQAWEEV